jgi:CBS-domain-containing membrane protein
MILIFLAIIALGTLNDYALQPIDFPIYFASLGAFAVLLFGMPSSPAIQPRAWLFGKKSKMKLTLKVPLFQQFVV